MLGTGLLVVMPIGITFLILKFFFDLLDPILQEPLLRYLPGQNIPGLGVVALVNDGSQPHRPAVASALAWAASW